MYIRVNLAILFVQLYRVGNACEMKTCEFLFSICFHSTTAPARFDNEVIKINFGTVNVFSQYRFLGLK